MLVAVLVALIVGACSANPVVPTVEATRTVVLDGRTLIVLDAGPDGMRGRVDFGAADGMLFDLGSDVDPTAVAFVMDDVPVDLDIAWFDGRGSLVGVARMAQCDAEPCQRYVAPAPFRWALEAPVGSLGELAGDARLVVP